MLTTSGYILHVMDDNLVNDSLAECTGVKVYLRTARYTFSQSGHNEGVAA